MASSSDQSPLLLGMNLLPSALIATIMTKLGICSIQSLASTCKTFCSCAAHTLSFVPTFHLFDIAALMDLLRPLLPSNPILEEPKELVDSLLNAGDRLFIIDFYSPGCGGCKALHPKICQLAEANPGCNFS
ncbi:unnamed protein product [Fraxinus pennsylvanica]|uniref:Thioredoxin domain-containing protein n=1 Tax=Fraxinus pennsylvanica TaxID=56036 RepID=A0AAD1Z2S6_9LAMI|nr:unnamed protein product [Fraxinus pennsylvanica]